jgi:hypothetical protein
MPQKVENNAQSEKTLDEVAPFNTLVQNRRRLKIFQNITLTKSSGGSSLANGGRKKSSPL